MVFIPTLRIDLPVVAVIHSSRPHTSSLRPQMAIIFSEEDLNDVKPPCVIQSFINHNAVLYKVFVVGDSYTVVERPSLKNFPSGPTGEDDHRGFCKKQTDKW